MRGDQLVAMAVAGQLVPRRDDAPDQRRVALGDPAQGEEGARGRRPRRTGRAPRPCSPRRGSAACPSSSRAMTSAKAWTWNQSSTSTVIALRHGAVRRRRGARHATRSFSRLRRHARAAAEDRAPGVEALRSSASAALQLSVSGATRIAGAQARVPDDCGAGRRPPPRSSSSSSAVASTTPPVSTSALLQRAAQQHARAEPVDAARDAAAVAVNQLERTGLPGAGRPCQPTARMRCST